MTQFEGKTKIYFWPDGFWCFEEDLEEYQTSRSDDFGIIHIPEEIAYDEEAVELTVQNQLNPLF
jgi:hypothetical protein